jgi:hypothetical protein
MINHTQTHCKRGHEFTPENTVVRSNGYWICRTCKRLNERGKPRSEQSKARRKVAAKLSLKLNPEKAFKLHKKTQVKFQFGISIEEYYARLASQNNTCALCNEPFEGVGATGLAPALDHSHNDGKLREFIHNSCNKGIGLLRDDPKICRLAAEYLEKHTGDYNVQS